MSENERLDQVPEEELNNPETETVEPAGDAKPVAAEKAKKAKDAKNQGKKPKEKKKGNRLTRWLREMKRELKKVQWPSFKEVLKHTGTVILCVLIIGVFIWVFDWVAREVVKALLDLLG